MVHRIQENINQSLNHWGCPALLHLTQPAVTLCLCTERKVLLHLASNKLHVLSARFCYGGRFMTLVNVTEQVRAQDLGQVLACFDHKIRCWGQFHKPQNAL